MLLPLARRYASWLALPAAATGDPDAEDPSQVQAMPLVLRLERAALPARSALLAAAAAAALAVCLDERAGPGGPWHEAVAAWVAGRIRKVARRARGAHWQAVAALDGVTVERGGAQVRALLPGRVADTPREVSRLQVGGTDLPADDPGAPPPGVPVLWLAPAVPMTVGKAAAQVGHASMLLAALLAADGADAELDRWAATGFECAVRTADARQWRELVPGGHPERTWRQRRVVAVRDAGFTEVAPGTVTCLAAA